jgi:hypothetical protein
VAKTCSVEIVTQIEPRVKFLLNKAEYLSKIGYGGNMDIVSMSQRAIFEVWEKNT